MFGLVKIRNDEFCEFKFHREPRAADSSEGEDHGKNAGLLEIEKQIT